MSIYSICFCTLSHRWPKLDLNHNFVNIFCQCFITLFLFSFQLLWFAHYWPVWIQLFLSGEALENNISQIDLKCIWYKVVKSQSSLCLGLQISLHFKMIKWDKSSFINNWCTNVSSFPNVNIPYRVCSYGFIWRIINTKY